MSGDRSEGKGSGHNMCVRTSGGGNGGWILKGTPHRSCGIDVARESEWGRGKIKEEKRIKRTPKAVKTNKMTVAVAAEGEGTFIMYATVDLNRRPTAGLAAGR